MDPCYVLIIVFILSFPHHVLLGKDDEKYGVPPLKIIPNRDESNKRDYNRIESNAGEWNHLRLIRFNNNLLGA